MKKLITIFILLFSITTFSQNEIKNDSTSTTESFETIVKSYLTKTLDFVEQEGKKVYNLASVEIPEVIKQYLLFKTINHGLYVFIGIVLLLFSIIKWGPKLIKEDNWETPLSILGYIPAIVGIILLIEHLFLFIKVTFMPKLYLVEKFINIL